MSTNQRKLLIVEDNPDEVFLLKRAFSKCSVENPIDYVTDGENAISYLTDYLIESNNSMLALILMDLKLPGKSGLEVLAWLRQQSGLERVPVVMFTSSQSDKDVINAYNLGANSYLVKPIAFDSLRSMVKTLVLYWLDFNVRPILGDDQTT